MLSVMNEYNIASKFKATICIPFVFGRIIVFIICIQPNSKDPLFGTALDRTNVNYYSSSARHFKFLHIVSFSELGICCDMCDALQMLSYVSLNWLKSAFEHTLNVDASYHDCTGLVCSVAAAVDFVTPLKKRRLARESLSVDGSLCNISEEEDSLSTRTASPPDAVQPIGTNSSLDNFVPAAHECQVTAFPLISY